MMRVKTNQPDEEELEEIGHKIGTRGTDCRAKLKYRRCHLSYESDLTELREGTTSRLTLNRRTSLSIYPEIEFVLFLINVQFDKI